MLRRVAAGCSARLGAGTVRRLPTGLTQFRFSAPVVARSFASKAAAAAPPAKTDNTQTLPATTGNNAVATATAPAPEQAQPVNSFSDIVSQMGGWYPFLGAAAVIAVSKELIIWNEETLLAINGIIVFIGLYTVASDVLVNMIENDKIAKYKKLRAIADLPVASLEQLVKLDAGGSAMASAWRVLKAELNANVEAIGKGTEARVKANLTEYYLEELEALKSKEVAAKDAATASVVSGASKYVRERISKLSDKEKQQIVDNAIELLSGKSKSIDVNRDPIKKIYLDYIQQAKA